MFLVSTAPSSSSSVAAYFSVVCGPASFLPREVMGESQYISACKWCLLALCQFQYFTLHIWVHEHFFMWYQIFSFKIVISIHYQDNYKWLWLLHIKVLAIPTSSSESVRDMSAFFCFSFIDHGSFVEYIMSFSAFLLLVWLLLHLVEVTCHVYLICILSMYMYL